MFLVRGIVFSYEAVREWEAKLAPALADELRQRRRGKRGARGRRWHVDKTYLKVGGRWAYLYRAIDRDGNLVDTILSEHCDMAAAQAFFRSEGGQGRDTRPGDHRRARLLPASDPQHARPSCRA